MAVNKRRRQSSRDDFDKRYFYLILGATGLVIIVLAVLLALRDDTTKASQTGNVVQRATDFTLPGLDGEVSLPDYRGRYVLVNFWATWCPPCKAEMPDLNAYHLAHQGEGFSVVAVNMGEESSVVGNFIRSNGFQFPVALDMTGKVFDQYGADSLPTSFLIGPDGKLVKTWQPGKLARATLEQDITPLLQG